jgi:hypothetical protein
MWWCWDDLFADVGMLELTPASVELTPASVRPRLPADVGMLELTPASGAGSRLGADTGVVSC